MVGYVSILNLPLRRAEAKRKLEALATSFAQVRTPPTGHSCLCFILVIFFQSSHAVPGL